MWLPTVRSMNQSKLEEIKQDMAKVNSDILGISKLRWTGIGEDSVTEQQQSFVKTSVF